MVCSGDTVVGVDRIPFKEGDLLYLIHTRHIEGKHQKISYRVSLGMMFS